MTKHAAFYCKLILQAPFFLLFLVSGFIPAFFLRRASNPWVISGHKGRLYDDNSGALHTYIRENTAQPILWVSSSSELTTELRSKGYDVLSKHSLFTRWKIVSAPVLIYSHGEDDLDNFLFFIRPFLGLRILLWHSLTFLKGRSKKQRLAWPDFDWAFAISDLEKQNMQSLFPRNANRICLGGAAHLDKFIYARGTAPERLIVYFPTHRETKQQTESLNGMISEIISDQSLINWLDKKNYNFTICRHINSTYPLAPSYSERFRFAEPHEITEQVYRSSLLISDYSSILSAYLVFNRPAIFFPFDLEEYLRFRDLHGEYQDICYGPRADSVESLIRLITQFDWKSAAFMMPEKRGELVKLFFNDLTPHYAESTYKAIRSKLHD